MTERMTAGEAWFELFQPNGGVWERMSDTSKEHFEGVATRILSDAAAIRERMGEGWQPIESSLIHLPDSKSRLVRCPERKNTYIVTRNALGDGTPYWTHFGSGYRLTEEPSYWLPWSAIPEPPQ